MMNSKLTLASLTAAGLMLGAASAHADVLADFDFAPAGDPTSDDTDAGSNAGAFTINSGANEGSASGDIGFSSGGEQAFVRTDATSGVGDDDFFSFTITADAGMTLNLDNIVLDAILTTTGTAPEPTGDSTVFVTDESNNVFGSTTFDTGGVTNSSGTISLGITGVTSQTFRFFFDDTVDDGGDINRLNSVVLNGTVIPEPASLALLGLGGLMLLPRRKRA